MARAGARNDPALAFRFEVALDDLPVGGFSECGGLQSEIEVHEHAVGLQLVDEACGVIARRRDREDVGALLFQQISCGSEEVRVVVHDDEPRGHDPYICSTVVEQRSDLTRAPSG